MNKLTALIEAAKAATPGPWMWPNVGSSDFVISDPDRLAIGHLDSPRTAEFVALASPTTILELCALLEKAEEALAHINEYWCGNRNDLAMFDACNNAVEVSEEPLAAIKQWKEQT